MKNKLTFLQRLALPFTYLHWRMAKAADPDNTKPRFSLVLSGMEKHQHNCRRLINERGYWLLRCDHPGCNFAEPLDAPEAAKLADRLHTVQQAIKTRAQCIVENAEFPDRVEQFKKELAYYEAVETEMIETIQARLVQKH